MMITMPTNSDLQADLGPVRNTGKATTTVTVLDGRLRVDAGKTPFYRVGPQQTRVHGVIRVAVSAYLQNVWQGTVAPGCAAADASTGNIVNTTMIPPRQAAKRVQVPDERRDNHHDVKIRGHHSFLEI